MASYNPLNVRKQVRRLGGRILSPPAIASGRTRGGPRRSATHWIGLILAAVLSAALLLTTYPQHTYADTGTSSFAPADLLNASVLEDSTSLYAASSVQYQSLLNFEQQAITNTLHDHGLPASDANAVQTWARPETESELWALIVQAIKSSARSTDQQNVVDWLTTVFQRQGVLAAQDAGLEYAKWAGLDQNQYRGLLSSNASESDLGSFLSGSVSNFPGYCTYVSPSPYANEYGGRGDQTCFTPCTSLLGCSPPTPTYDQFIKWGEADVNNQLFNSSDFGAAGRSIAIATSLAAGFVAAGVTSVAVSSALAGVMAGTALQLAVFPFSALVVTTSDIGALSFISTAESVAIGSSITAGAVAAVAAVIIVAVISAVLEGINVFTAASLPGKLAHAIVAARTNTVDLNGVLAAGGGAQGLYSLFVGLTTPTPTLATCDNSIIPISNAGTAAPPQCMNAPAIPAAASTDPLFKVTRKDSTTPTYGKSISFDDTTQNVSITTRVSGAHWFVNTYTASDNSTATVQSLRLHYTDWSGQGNTVWLTGESTQGFQFIGVPDATPSGSAVNPTTCLTDKTCFTSDSIQYVGTDGHDYTASLVPNADPVLTVTSDPNPVEGTAQSFSASATSILNQSVTFTWEFEQQNDNECAPPVNGIANCTLGTSGQYGAPVTGDSASHTWPRSGTWHVRVTATDALGNTTVKTITVAVAAVAPTLTVDPAAGSAGCTTGATCDARTVDLGNVVMLAGTVGHAGSGDEETVSIDWGDGQTTVAKLGWEALYSATDLTISRTSDTIASFSGTHTYAKFGHYTAGITVTDATGATVIDSAAMTIRTTPQLVLAAPDPMVYGTKLSWWQLAATASDGPYSSVPGTLSYTVDGTPVSIGTVVAAGSHTLTVSFAPDDGAVYKTPNPVSVPLVVQPAPLAVTASNLTMTLHGTVPALTFGYNAFVNGEGPSVLTAVPHCSTTATGASAVGAYPITCSGGSAPNYSLSYKPGTLSVLYRWSGFSAPINDPIAGATAMSVFKSGSTISVKFQLKDATGTVLPAGSAPVFSVSPLQSCSTGTATSGSSTTAPADTGSTYRWDARAKQYVYNYRTPASPGTCQYIRAALDDGTTQQVLVAYR